MADCVEEMEDVALDACVGGFFEGADPDVARVLLAPAASLDDVAGAACWEAELVLTVRIHVAGSALDLPLAAQLQLDTRADGADDILRAAIMNRRK